MTSISDRYSARAEARRAGDILTVVHPPRVPGANVPATTKKEN